MSQQLTVLLTGAGGQLGQELQCCIPDTVQLHAMDSRSLDVADKAAVQSAFERFSPDVVINAAAYTAVDKAEEEKERAFAVNAEAPRYLAEVCKGTTCRIIHISTDFVFDGMKSSPYLPDDAVNPLSVYGYTKWVGETVVRDLSTRFYIARTAWLYGPGPRNFVRTVLRLASQREELSMVTDEVGSPTYAADALQTVDDIMETASAWGAELRQDGKPVLKMGAAVATGRIIFGAVGDESRMEYTVIGDAVNLSAKLEKHTKSEVVRALCTASAFDIAFRQGYQPAPTVEQRKSRNIEGVARPIDIIVLAP